MNAEKKFSSVVEEAIGDVCSICLDPFCERNPSTLTDCRHEFHHNCILDWCKRSSDCPMCLQHIKLKDPSSQGLLDKVNGKRIIGSLVGPNPELNDCITCVSSGSGSDNEPFRFRWPKMQKKGESKSPGVESVYRDELPVEALNMLPGYISSTVKTVNKSVGFTEAEGFVKKSDEEVLNSSVSHLMKAAVLMVEHERRAVDLRKVGQKASDELSDARDELSDARDELSDAHEEIAKLRKEKERILGSVRESANALKRANRAAKAKEEMKEQVKQLKDVALRLKEVVAATEVELAALGDRFIALKNDLEKAREEMADLRMEKGQWVQSKKDLDKARVEIADLRREKEKALERAGRVEEKMDKLKVELNKVFQE